MSDPSLTPDGYDRIGPLHPYVAWGGVLLFDLLLVAAIVTVLLVAADWTEDLIWPGGPEWLPF
ncbi:hypothetical protein [Sphingomonas sp.]